MTVEAVPVKGSNSSRFTADERFYLNQTWLRFGYPANGRRKLQYLVDKDISDLHQNRDSKMITYDVLYIEKKVTTRL